VTKIGAGRQYPIVSEPDRSPDPGLEAFDAIYERELDYVWRTLARLGVATADLGDGAHEVFIVVYRRWGDIDQARPIRPWLFGVARRVAAGMRRKRVDIPSDELTPSTPGAGDQIAQRDLLWRALGRLSEERRDVLVLHDLEGQSGAEIAAMLDIPVNTVHSRLRLARAEMVDIICQLRGRP
jgi:RNA polymerase sigma-70 factor, ECF subfamily